MLKSQDFDMWCGESKLLKITVLDEDTGLPVDLTNATINWIMQKSSMNNEYKFPKSTGNGVSITDPTNGIFAVALQPADTADLPGGTYYHEGRITDQTGNVSTVIYGKVTLTPSNV